MAKYDVTYSCGHTETVQLYGSNRERDQKIRWYEKSCLCSKCYAEKQAADRAAELESAKILTAELPTLTGSEKQISWATTIRAKIMAEKENIMANIQADKINLITGIVDDITNKTQASWWIDNRQQNLASLIVAAYKTKI
jgi:hypothetical protein